MPGLIEVHVPGVLRAYVQGAGAIDHHARRVAGRVDALTRERPSPDEGSVGGKLDHERLPPSKAHRLVRFGRIPGIEIDGARIGSDRHHATV